MSKEATQVDRSVGVQIRIRRNELGLSQQQLGEGIGVTFQQVQKYEKGTNRVGASRLAQVARVLKVPVSYFFGDIDDIEGDDGEMLQVLAVPGAAVLLASYAAIRSPEGRRAVLELAKSLASRSASSASEAPAKIRKHRGS